MATSVPRLSMEVARALHEGEFVVHLQPQVSLADGAIVGVEALARWRHPTLGLLLPMTFLPAVERADLLSAFSFRMVREALAAQRRLAARGIELPLAVNLPPEVIARRAALPLLREVVDRYRPVPGSVTVEMVEASPLANGAHERIFDDLHRLGLRVALDDFGTGFSSLSDLVRLCVDEIKIDRSFVGGMHASQPAAEVVRFVAELGASLEVRVVAEGVERSDALTRLRAWGVGVAQGFLLAKPMPPAELVASFPQIGRRTRMIVSAVARRRRQRRGHLRLEEPLETHHA